MVNIVPLQSIDTVETKVYSDERVLKEILL